MIKLILNASVAAIFLVSSITSVQAEQAASGSRSLVLSGFSDISYVDQDDTNSNLVSRFVPIFLFQVSDNMLFESELEFSIDEDGETEIEMEYADISYFLNDYTTVIAGKFLLPFGTFGPNLHPSWINKLPSMPAVYGHHGGGSLSPLLPIFSDTGINIRNQFTLGPGKLFVDLYLVSGPREATGHDDHEMDEEVPAMDEEMHDEVAGEMHDEAVEEHGDEHGVEFPEVGFDSSQGDNNDDLAFGGRVAYAFLPQWEVGYSYYSGVYNDDNQDDGIELNYNASSIDFNWATTYTSIRGEIIKTTTEALVDESVEEFDRNGWYVQGSWNLRQLDHKALAPFELVLRRSEITKNEGGERWTFGVNYWLTSSAVIKVAFDRTELEDGDTDNRVFVQFAFGF